MAEEHIIRMTHRYNIDGREAVFIGKEAGPAATYNKDYVLKMPREEALPYDEGDIYVIVVKDDEEWHDELREDELHPETQEPTGRKI